MYRVQLFSTLFMCIGILVSCNSNQLVETNLDISEQQSENALIADNPFVISEDKILDAAASFFTNDVAVTLRSASNADKRTFVQAKQYQVKNEKLSEENGMDVKQFVPVYTINYKTQSDNKAVGFVMMVGDERVTKNMLIYSDIDNFDLLQRADADFLDDLIAGYLYKSINKAEQVEPKNVAQKSNGNNEITTRYYYTTTGGYTYNLNAICFSQNYPYNKYVPFRNGTRALAGCVAVAVSEIMAYHEWPQQGVFKRYTTNTSTPETVNVSYTLTALEREGVRASNMDFCAAFCPGGIEYVANLIAEIGYRFNLNYGTEVTLGPTVFAPDVFSAMGYTTGTYQTFSLAPIQNDIQVEEIPVIMTGDKYIGDPLILYNQNNYMAGGHAYVIAGVSYTTATGQIHLRIINGTSSSGDYTNNGHTNCWFNYLMFSTSETSSNYNGDPYHTYPYPELIYPYRYNCKIIPDIRPNPNNTGCINANWRVRNLYPY